MTYRWKLDCDDYLRNYLSAHADAQLSMRQRLVAELHVRECLTCETSLFEERSVKGLVRNTLGMVRAPAEVKKQIRKLLREPTSATKLRLFERKTKCGLRKVADTELSTLIGECYSVWPIKGGGPS
jgi:hypothetical protein